MTSDQSSDDATAIILTNNYSRFTRRLQRRGGKGIYAPASAFLETLLNKGTARCGLQVSLKARSANSIAKRDISFEAPRFPFSRMERASCIVSCIKPFTVNFVLKDINVGKVGHDLNLLAESKLAASIWRD